MIPAQPGYAWWWHTIAETYHQYPVDAKADGDGFLEALCERLAVNHRVDRTECTDPKVLQFRPFCPDCLVASPANDLADRMEEISAEIAEDQRRS